MPATPHVIVDPRLAEELQARGMEVVDFYDRLLDGDFGDIPEIEQMANELALANGGTVIAFYDLSGSEGPVLTYDCAQHILHASWRSGESEVQEHAPVVGA